MVEQRVKFPSPQYQECKSDLTRDPIDIVAYGPTLYEFSSGHPSWLAALAALVATMLVSLVRVWSVTLHRRFQ